MNTYGIEWIFVAALTKHSNADQSILFYSHNNCDDLSATTSCLMKLSIINWVDNFRIYCLYDDNLVILNENQLGVTNLSLVVIHSTS